MAVMLSVHSANGATFVYQNAFQDPVGPEWSQTRRSITPNGGREYLGDFANTNVTLTVSNLPPHTNLVISFSLYLLRTWDGNGNCCGGPDVWSLAIDGGDTLIRTSFSHTGGAGNRQAYPGSYPVADNPAMTGAFQENTLGYSYDLGSEPTPYDAVYRIVVPVAHGDESVVFRFASSGSQGLADESWGLDDIQVAVNGTPPITRILSPAAETGFTAPASTLLTAAATDPDGVVKQVEFFANGTSLGIATNAPYTLIVTNLQAGIYPLSVATTDDSGFTSVASTRIRVNGLRGEYHSGLFAGTAVIRQDSEVSFNWNSGPPLAGIGPDNFSVRWTGLVVPRFSEACTFLVTADDGVRLWIDGRRVIDDWTSGSARTRSAAVSLEADRPARIQLDYFEATSSASVKLEWQSTRQPRQVIPVDRLYPPTPGANRPPNRPAIAWPPVSDDFVNSTNAAFATEFFTDADGPATHAATDWEIWTDTPTQLVWAARGIGGTNRTRISLPRGTFVNSLAGARQLPLNAHYRLRVRFKDSSGDPSTEWSEDAELRFHTFTPEFLIGPGSTWRFQDDGSEPGTNWTEAQFNDQRWKTGRGSFGYGDRVGEGTLTEAATTALAFGTSSSNRFITSYFRHSFQVEDASRIESLKLTVMRDDGIAAYLNGVEIFRDNLPVGPAGNRTLALTKVQGVDRYRLIEVPAPATLLRSGPNVLAAELHQVAPTDGDAAFYAELTALRKGVGSMVTLVSSDFEGGNNEGWGIFLSEGRSSPDSMSYTGSGGSPGGHISIYDPGDGQSFLWNAPAVYRTNLSAAYGGFIEFSAKASSVGNHRSMVILSGSRFAIHADTPYIRRTTWLPFRVPVDESLGWRRSSVTNYFDANQPATRDEIMSVLADVRGFRIEGEAFGTSDTAWLDSVRIVAPAGDALAPLAIEPASDGLLVLRWPANRPGLVLESSPVLTSDRWTPLIDGPPLPSPDGFRRTSINSGASTQFYRLRRVTAPSL